MGSDEDFELPASVGSSSYDDLLQLPDVDDSDSDAEKDVCDADPEDGREVDDADSDSDVELPPGTDTPCTCSRGCAGLFTSENIDALRRQRLTLAPKDKKRALFQDVKAQMCNAFGEVLKKKTAWELGGKSVCRGFWQFARATGSGQVDVIRKLVQGGHQVAPEPKRMPRELERSKWFEADEWFLHLYRGLGEPMAIDDPDLLEEAMLECLEDSEHPLFIMHYCLGPEQKRYVPKRYLNPGTFEDLWMMHQGTGGGVGRSTLYRVWKERWARFLPFRNVGQGKRCKVCARISEERVRATTLQEKADIIDEKSAHVQEVMADRNVSSRGARMAERDAQSPTPDGQGQVLKVVIDGMDQAKFKCPRNLASSAELECLWRPQLHVVGAIVHGHVEAYYIMDADLAKDANMNCTVLSRTFDVVHVKASKPGSGHALPRNLIVSADNTARESKNQHFANFSGYLVGTERFDCVENQFLKTGHTHNELDQRFSSVATALSRAPSLEDKEEFAEWIRSKVKPAAGRTLHVEVLDTTYDFQSWFYGLDAKISGLASTHFEPDTCHVWRFIRRSLVPTLETDVHHELWEGLAPQDADVIMIVKESMSATHMSQPPVLFQPHAESCALEPGSLAKMPRNELKPRVLKEYRKTARVLGEKPWELFKAQQYLQDLCDKNEQRQERVGFLLKFIFEYKMKEVEALGVFPLPVIGPPMRVPRAIEVARCPPAEQKRRLLKRPATVPTKELEDSMEDPDKDEAAEALHDDEHREVLADDEAEQDPGDDPRLVSDLALVAVGETDPAPAPPPPTRHGCGKCRYGKMGCNTCRAWADSGHRGYSRGPNNEVIKPTPN